MYNEHKWNTQLLIGLHLGGDRGHTLLVRIHSFRFCPKVEFYKLNELDTFTPHKTVWEILHDLVSLTISLQAALAMVDTLIWAHLVWQGLLTKECLYRTVQAIRKENIPTSLHHYIPTSLHPYITTSLHPYITTSLHRYITTSFITTSLHHYISETLNMHIRGAFIQGVRFLLLWLSHQSYPSVHRSVSQKWRMHNWLGCSGPTKSHANLVQFNQRVKFVHLATRTVSLVAVGEFSGNSLHATQDHIYNRQRPSRSKRHTFQSFQSATWSLSRITFPPPSMP